MNERPMNRAQRRREMRGRARITIDPERMIQALLGEELDQKERVVMAVLLASQSEFDANAEAENVLKEWATMPRDEARKLRNRLWPNAG